MLEEIHRSANLGRREPGFSTLVFDDRLCIDCPNGLLPPNVHEGDTLNVIIKYDDELTQGKYVKTQKELLKAADVEVVSSQKTPLRRYKGFVEVLPFSIFLALPSHTTDLSRLKALGITHALYCTRAPTEEIKAFFPANKISLLTITAKESDLTQLEKSCDEARTFIDQCRISSGRLLVCGEDALLTASIVLCHYLLTSIGATLDAAYDHICRCNSEFLPSFNICSFLQRVEVAQFNVQPAFLAKYVGKLMPGLGLTDAEMMAKLVELNYDCNAVIDSLCK